jgi:hypothetical protein
MDYMYAKLGVKYPLTIEVYGGGDPGKMKGVLMLILCPHFK